MQHTAPGAIVCLTGVAASRQLSVDVGALNNELVLENDVVFGSVNANRRHFEQAVASLGLDPFDEPGLHVDQHQQRVGGVDQAAHGAESTRTDASQTVEELHQLHAGNSGLL